MNGGPNRGPASREKAVTAYAATPSASAAALKAINLVWRVIELISAGVAPFGDDCCVRCFCAGHIGGIALWHSITPEYAPVYDRSHIARKYSFVSSGTWRPLKWRHVC